MDQALHRQCRGTQSGKIPPCQVAARIMEIVENDQPRPDSPVPPNSNALLSSTEEINGSIDGGGTDGGRKQILEKTTLKSQVGK